MKNLYNITAEGMVFAVKTTARELHEFTELDRKAYEEYHETRVSNYGDLGRIVANITNDLSYVDLAQELSEDICEQIVGTELDLPSDFDFLESLVAMAKERESR